MNIYQTDLSEVLVIDYDIKFDNRGFSHQIYCKEELEKRGIFFDYVEEIIYAPEKAGTLYGIHFQNKPKAQAKLLYCIQGSGFDYAVDLRKESPTYLQWVSVELSASNRKQIYIPSGFGHAFISTEDNTRVVMRFDEPFDSQYSKQLAYNDPEIGIEYFTDNPILAPHDVNAPLLKDCEIDL